MNKIVLLVCISLASINLYATYAIPSGMEDYFLNLVKPYDKEYNSFTLKNINISQNNVKYEYCSDDCFYIILKGRYSFRDSNLVSKNFAIYTERLPDYFDITPLINQIIKNDTGEVFTEVYEPNPSSIGRRLSVIIYLYFMVILLLFILSYLKIPSDIINRYLNSFSDMNLWIYWGIALLIIMFSAFLRFKNIYHSVYDDGNALRLLFSYDSVLYNLFISRDPRHPGLYFALLKPLLLFSTHPEYAARIFSAALSVLSVLIIGLIIKEKNRLNSLIAMILLAIHPEYIYRSREITDISLFVLMSLISIYFLRKAMLADKLVDKLLFALFLGFSCLSSYAAYINFAGILLYLIINGKIKQFAKFLILSLFMVSPYLVKILFSLKDEFYAKSIAGRFPQIIWGSESVPNFINRVLSDLFVQEYTLILFAFSIPVLYMNLKRDKSDLLFLLLFVTNLCFILFFQYFRMKTYYIIFLPISFILLVTDINWTENKTLVAKGYNILFLIFVSYLFFNSLNARFESTYVQGYHLRTNPALIIEKIKEEGIKDIVIDVDNNKSILGYYFFERPYETLIKKGCKIDEGNLLICYEERSGRRITALTMAMQLSRDWKMESINKLRSVKYPDFYFFYDINYENSELLNFLRNKCSYISYGEKYILFRCKRIEQ
ncbi:MAG: glycosyltransferase family 39 protein [Myxococcota bacterium]